MARFYEWKSKFIQALREKGVVKYAAESAGISRDTAYKARKRNSRFAAEWDDAKEESADSLELEARRRAVEGTDRPVIYQGEITNTYKDYSDTLLIFLLKAYRPEKFRDRHDITSGGEPVTPIQFVNAKKPDDNDA